MEKILEILEYQYPGVSKFLEEFKDKLKIEKIKKKIIVYFEDEVILMLNPRFGLFVPSKKFSDILFKIGKYIKVKKNDLEFIKQSKNIYKINVEEFSKNLYAFEDFALVIENKIIGVGRAKISYDEFLKSKRGLVAVVKKFFDI